MFSQLGLSPAICQTLEKIGYTTPTSIQNQSIPVVLTGVDLIARAQTGTGKTAAFGLPMIERLGKRGMLQAPRALVLVPTRELAQQVHDSLKAYAADARLRVAVIFGGVGMPGQIHSLRRGADIIVATPGRLIDHMQKRTVDLSKIDMLTLDEADRMLDMGFIPALRQVVRALPQKRQTLLFSATFPDAILKLAAEFLQNPTRVDASGDQMVAAPVTHVVHQVTSDRKRDALGDILHQHAAHQALVFCKTKRGANRVGEDLEGRGIPAGVIHGNKSQNARTRALDDFKSGRVRVLVATDIAARGLDISKLPLVVNFDLPLVAADYVHRVGRTGRAGHTGRAVSLVSPEDAPLLREIQRLINAPLERHTHTPSGPATPHIARRAVASPGAGHAPAHRRSQHGSHGSHHGQRSARHGGDEHPHRPGGFGAHRRKPAGRNRRPAASSGR